MRGWRGRLEERSFGWFVSVALLTAVAVVFCGGGFGGSPPVVGQTEPLALALSAPQICETGPAKGYSGSNLRQDAEGNWIRFDAFVGYFGHAEVDVGWEVSGGTGPYRLTIDGETRDPAHEYVGASGTASVSCAMTSGAEAFIRSGVAERGYKEQPEVNSGVKTIPATVTDATGATAEASVNVYVVLKLGSSGDILESGKTYRAFEGLLTVPVGVDLEVVGGADGGGRAVYFLRVVGATTTIALEEWTHREVSRRVPEEEAHFHAVLDELVASAGLAPLIETDAQ